MKYRTLHRQTILIWVLCFCPSLFLCGTPGVYAGRNRILRWAARSVTASLGNAAPLKRDALDDRQGRAAA